MQKVVQDGQGRLGRRPRRVQGDHGDAVRHNLQLGRLGLGLVGITAEDGAEEIEDGAHGTVLVLLVPFNEEIKQLQGRLLGQGEGDEGRRCGLGALLNKPAELGARIAGRLLGPRSIL